MGDAILIGIAMGVGGTLAMDVWAWVLNRAAGQPMPNWAMPGRWLAHISRGRVFHDDIGKAEPVGGERGLGWALHYGVGVIYGLLFIFIMGEDWRAEPTFWPVWVFSILTIAAGWFLLQPGMGLGWAASKTPNPWKARVMGLIAHTMFALGMFATAVAF
ncbi:MAG: DUF2938 domain-containing protein [Paracoccaceae bacterium]|nr:DUF2938 domain-containing protein [Paracoccaceae bacterium]